MKKKKIILSGFCTILAISALFVLVACGSSNTSSGEFTNDMEIEDGFIEGEPTDESNGVREQVEAKDVSDILYTPKIEVKSGSTKSDILSAVEYDVTKVNSCAFNWRDLDLNTPGEYTIQVTLFVPLDVAQEILGDVDENAERYSVVADIAVDVT